jgi:endoglucanase
MGEFGCLTTSDAESRARFYRDFRRALDQAGIGWAVWDWKAGFRYWNPRTNRPEEGMREALFGQ